MKYIKVLLTLASLVLITGCGDSRISEMRGAFIEGCRNGGATKDVCKCIFQQYEKHYTTDQLLNMKIGIAPDGFRDFTLKSTAQCIKDN